MAIKDLTKEELLSSIAQQHGMWLDILEVRPNYTFNDLRRNRPYLCHKLLDQINADGSISMDADFYNDLKRFFSFIPQEGGLRSSEIEVFNQIIDKTIDAGLMNPDYTWCRTTTKTQIALWVDLLTKELHIPYKWKWAEERWDISNLKQALSNNRNQHQYVIDQDIVTACFEY